MRCTTTKPSRQDLDGIFLALRHSGLSQKELAQRAGITSGTISRLFGGMPVKHDTLNRVRIALDSANDYDDADSSAEMWNRR